MKQFYATISMQPASALNRIKYTLDWDKERDVMATSFPVITMLETNLAKDEKNELILIYTEDDNERYKHSCELFKKELDELSEKLDIEIKVVQEIAVPHNESRSKHIEFFNKMCHSFKPESDVYMDITYGSKVTSVSCFASLTYAEKIMNCDLKQIIYGKYNHGDKPYGTIYDIRCLYELSGLIHSASAINGLNVDKMLEMFGGEK